MIEVDGVQILREGETPWSYSDNPGWIEGPWEAEDEDALVELLETEAGLKVTDYWDRTDAGKGFWVVA